MFNKLKRKLLWMNLTMISILMLASFVTIYVITYRSSQNSIERDLLKVVENFQLNAGAQEYAIKDLETQANENKDLPKTIHHLMPDIQQSFVIQVDENMDSVLNNAYFEADETLFNYAMERIKTQNKTASNFIYDNNQWSYISSDIKDGYIYAFLNTTSRWISLKNLFLSFAIVFAGVFVMVFILSRYLTNQSTKPIKDAFERQEQFISDASHELKTPLTVINTNIDLILEDQDIKESEHGKWLEYIKLEVRRMTKMTKDLLYLAQVDEQGQEKFDVVDFSKITNHQLLGMEVLAFEKNITLRCNVESDISVYGNKEQLSQVVMILLDNALKYTDDNGMVDIMLSQVSNYAVLTVKNSCEGIFQEQIDKIFDRFYRRDKARTREEGNHGLGLSIAKAIIEGHGGEISCYSVADENITFEVKLKIK